MARGRPILATCAGLILLARTVTGPAQRSLGAVDITVARNGWGRQVESFEATSDEPFEEGAPLPLVCIRAPRIMGTGPGVEVLARFQGEPVLVRDGNVLGATFHPELTTDPRVHARAFPARSGKIWREGEVQALTRGSAARRVRRG
jgi:5'-phosphate synthase pdxT subunit